jgi:hypothetical protein
MGEDFTEKSKRTLADRAGHLCSICNQPTTCSDGEGKPFRIADAAHIVGASSEGPRGDEPIAHDKASPENGIWLCARCHRNIDGDPNRYSSEELHVFKEEAEERARRLVHGESICQVMESTQRTIGTFLRRNSLPSLPVLRGNEYLLGVQAIPLRLITEPPNWEWRDMVQARTPGFRFRSGHPSTNTQGIFSKSPNEAEFAALSKRGIAQGWKREGLSESAKLDKGRFLLPNRQIITEILWFKKTCEEVYKDLFCPMYPLAIRLLLKNVKSGFFSYTGHTGHYSVSPDAVIEADQIEVGPRLLDTSDFEKLIEDLWFSAGGSHGLPKEIKDLIASCNLSD